MGDSETDPLTAINAGRPGVPAGPASPRSRGSSAKPDARPPPLGGSGTRRVGPDLASAARCRQPVHSKPRSVKQLNPSKVSVCPHESHSQISPRAREPRTSSRKPSMSLRTPATSARRGTPRGQLPGTHTHSSSRKLLRELDDVAHHKVIVPTTGHERRYGDLPQP